ncbi:TMEM165/GDT1 family protein [bacterium]|nr:TMEM165/GDT1 family protein [bacterium]
MLTQFFKIFIAVFLAELGDKTQLAVLGFAASVKPGIVFAAASTALVVITAIGAIVGATAGKFVPQKIVNISAGILFVAIGALYIIKGFK